jgi:putative spermidine/putrescine transport system ATP-binding protein
VELRELSRSYGDDVHALRGINLSVAPGEFVTLLGPSGSGKSTILKLVAGIDHPSTGEILMDGQSVVDVPAHFRSIGMVFQNYALFPHMTVGQNIEFPLRVRDLPEKNIQKRAREAIDITRLNGLEHRLPREISGGQQQRVALARAIVFDPKVLLMDEPLGALDRHLREELKIEIKRIHQSLKITILFVTHDQDEALLLSDRVVVMRDGGIEQVAPPRELYTRPCNRFVAGFVGEANVLNCRISPDGLHLGKLRLPGNPLRESVSGGVSVMIRPELIKVSEAAMPGSIEARLREQFFLGETTRLIAEIGENVVSVKGLSNSLPSLVAGQPIHLCWRPEDLVILSD